MNNLKCFLFVIILGLSIKTFACDVCGGSTLLNAGGILVMNNQNSVGLTYNYRSFKTTHPSIFGNPTYTQENLHTTQFWGKWQVSPKFQLGMRIPLNYYFQKGDEVSFENPVGDIELFSGIRLLNLENNSAHKLWFFATVKLPTGNYKPERSQYVPLLLPGTGSVDIQGSFSYFLQAGKWNGLAAFGAQYKGENTLDYQFGASAFGQLNAFYNLISNENFSFFPGLELEHQTFSKDTYEGVEQLATGGYMSQLKPYISGTLNQVWFKGVVGIPILHDLGSGQVKPYPTLQLTVSYLF